MTACAEDAVEPARRRRNASGRDSATAATGCAIESVWWLASAIAPDSGRMKASASDATGSGADGHRDSHDRVPCERVQVRQEPRDAVNPQSILSPGS
jgi:hypothetical protein